VYYTVSLASKTGEGSVTNIGSHAAGASVTITASPASTWGLHSLKVNGNDVSNGHTFAITGDVSVSVEFGMLDASDSGKVYKVITAAGLYWTAVNYSYNGNGVSYGSGSSDGSGEPFPNYGKHYNRSEAESNAPSGWRLPTQAEIQALASEAGGVAGIKASYDWMTPGTDALGFCFLPAGRKSGTWPASNSQSGTKFSGYLWTTTERLYLHHYSTGLNFDVPSDNTTIFMSVRYVKPITA
jgi:uncharacterized protein (TIGR02145 family)